MKKVMTYQIENRLSRIIPLPLNSGEILYLKPFATSDLVADEELNDNTAVTQLLHKQAIFLRKVETCYPPGGPAA